MNHHRNTDHLLVHRNTDHTMTHPSHLAAEQLVAEPVALAAAVQPQLFEPPGFSEKQLVALALVGVWARALPAVAPVVVAVAVAASAAKTCLGDKEDNHSCETCLHTPTHIDNAWVVYNTE